MNFARLLLSLAAFYLLPISVQAQLTEHFIDGDFNSNPAWTGTDHSWMINSSMQLQSNNTVANSSFYIATSNALSTVAHWEFSITLSFNTSSANYVDVYLTASDSVLMSNKTTGYFVRIGNTDDEISLYRKDSTGTIKKIIDGTNNVTNTSSNKLKIKVIRDDKKEFHLFYDTNNTGSFTSEASVIDSTFTTSAYFGFLIRQSTSSFFQKHYFDDIVIQPYAPDTIPPSIHSVTATSANTLDLQFTEQVDSSAAQTETNYNINDIGAPISVQTDATNATLVHLTFASNFKNGIPHILTVTNLKDKDGNKMDKDTATFSFYSPQRFDVVIDEIMADPSPVVGLPNAEYIELKNLSGKEINLKGWKLATASSNSSAFPDYILPADSFVIITSTSNAQAMTVYGNTLGVGSFPALDNDGTTITLLSKEGVNMNTLSYDPTWYRNEVKEEGGWSLEMIDTHYPCSGQGNWKASTHQSGGTPGKKNAVDAINIDEDAPVIKSAALADSTTIMLTFNEPVDSTKATDINHYKITPAIAFKSAFFTNTAYTEVALKLQSPLATSTVYTLTTTGISDCSGNEISNQSKVFLGKPQVPESNDIVINETLFNPKPNAYDYIEIFNRSNKIIDAAQLYIANRNSAGNISSLKKLSEKPFYVLPGDYIVITEDAYSLQQAYLVKNVNKILTLSSLPSFPDDKGNVLLLNGRGEVVDEVSYSKDWHFALIADDEGVALERLDPDAASQNKSNWHSAASTAGYGTPTYKNSQYKQTDLVNATIEVSPKVFSPDNDGYEDIAGINYRLSESGYVANVLIFDASGRLVRSLIKNGTLGLNGSWNWDGLDEKKQKLPVGTYILFTELFNLQGKRMQFKNVIVLARKL